MFGHHLFIRDILGYFAQSIHVVRKGEQTGRRFQRQHLKGVAHHGRPHHFSEGADMGESGRAVTGLKQHVALLANTLFEPSLKQGAGFGKGPGIALASSGDEVAHSDHPGLRRRRTLWARPYGVKPQTKRSLIENPAGVMAGLT